MKIPDFKRSGIGLIAEFRGIPNGFANLANFQLILIVDLFQLKQDFSVCIYSSDSERDKISEGAQTSSSMLIIGYNMASLRDSGRNMASLRDFGRNMASLWNSGHNMASDPAFGHNFASGAASGQNFAFSLITAFGHNLAFGITMAIGLNVAFSHNLAFGLTMAFGCNMAFIVESASERASQIILWTPCKLIDALSSEGAQFAPYFC
jgi:hypothetical protein